MVLELDAIDGWLMSENTATAPSSGASNDFFNIIFSSSRFRMAVADKLSGETGRIASTATSKH